jgi:hypothetical protein
MGGGGWMEGGSGKGSDAAMRDKPTAIKITVRALEDFQRKDQTNTKQKLGSGRGRLPRLSNGAAQHLVLQNLSA